VNATIEMPITGDATMSTGETPMTAQEPGSGDSAASSAKVAPMPRTAATRAHR
jgi:hypothetical protein